MTLHEAIRDVLRAAGKPMTPREIADEVNRRNLYERGDAQPIGPGQVSARARRYEHLFDRDAKRIALAR